MKVLLQQTVQSLGKAGQVVEVSESYARNFLLPKKLAVAATAEALRRKERDAAFQAKQQADSQARDAAFIASLQSKRVSISAPASPNGKLFAAFQERDLRTTLAQQHQLQLTGSIKISGLPIKHTGEHQLTFTTPGGQQATLTITISGI